MDDSIPCSICGQPANVHWTKVINDKVTNIHLCESCAAKSNEIHSLILPLAQIALSIIKSKIKEDEADDAPAKKCPRCGLTTSEFARIGRPGCVHCYSTFDEEISQIILRIQPGKKHKGKRPVGSTLKSALYEALVDAQARMNNAIKTENYEDAANLRDEIKKIEVSLGIMNDKPASL
ncbi:MAG: UvrB/UvrC motif-containing protein [Puniceicoccales bacterium]|jgi:protein arginine kinase activator|nr:UvrB/UvrC motif-containing protein [Puniceicoccales bacterium]